MKSFSLTFCFLIASLSFSQEDKVFNRLHSTNISNAVYLNFNGNGFEYIKSPDDKLPIKIESDRTKMFQVHNDDQNNFRLFLKFYNPLQFKISHSSSELEDENYQAISSFIENLPADFALISPISSTNTASSLAPTGASSKNLLSQLDNLLNSLPYTSPYFYDWSIMFQENIDKNEFTEQRDINELKEKINTINGIKDVEKYLFSKISITKDRTTVSKRLQEWVKSIHDSLRKEKSDLKVFEDNLSYSKYVKNKLVQEKNEANTNLKNLKELLTNNVVDLERMLKSKSTVVKSGNFNNLTQSKLVLLDASLTEKLNQYELSIKKLTKLIDKLEQFVKDFKILPSYKELDNTSFPWNYNKAKLYEVTGIKLNKEGDEIKDSESKIKVKVQKSQGRMAVFASVGLFHTPYEYKNYGISGGTVAETQGDAVNIRPAAYLNLLFKPKKGDIFYPMFQIGITQGIKTPIFPVGIGFSISNRFSITGGPLLAFQNELSSLKLGDTADDATLKDDIVTDLNFSWYLSINYKLGK